MKEEKRYTNEEIWKMFDEDNTLDQEFRSEVLGRLDATYHAMAMCVLERDKMTMADEHGDRWLNEWNRFVSLYQKYHNQ
jgi:hypothetical protein